ncbi:MAG: D-threo-aldose 1-dehydrogenase [Candidatus Omnitrophica bacterium ADurb.Bin277]|nr:MAG: D-threo-aldose 1-dehydrogenase [Candidatus Omnitrophica bacterium ADurb.Bin277]
MRSRKLGRTGFEISEIGFGCWAIGGNAYGRVNDGDSLCALEAAWSSGVNFFDTADIYGEGHSETLLARFLKGKLRDTFFVATKVGWDFYPSSPGRPDSAAGPIQNNHAEYRKNFDAAYVRFACEKSLMRLGQETIDLYQLHNPSLELIRSGEPVSVLEKLRREGKIRAIGISVHREAEALAALEDPRIESLQIILNIMDQRMSGAVFDKACEKNTGIIVREALASGLLTGKYPPAHKFPRDDHRRRWSAEKRECDWEKVQLILKTLGCRNDQLPQSALEFVLSFNEVSTVIPGAKTCEQVMANLQAVISPRLSREAMIRLKKLYTENPIFREGLLPR